MEYAENEIEKLSVAHEMRRRTWEEERTALDAMHAEIQQMEFSTQEYATTYLVTLQNRQDRARELISDAEARIWNEREKIMKQEKELEVVETLLCHVLHRGHKFESYVDGYGGSDKKCRYCGVNEEALNVAEHGKFPVDK